MTTKPTSGAADVATAAQAVVDRWDTPLWKDVPATAEYIGRLRAALAAGQATAAKAVVPSGWNLVPTEPTQAMLDAVVTSMDDFLLGKEAEKQYREDWAAMLAAAPAQPVAEQGVASAALPDEREAFEAMMRSQTFDSLKRLSDGSYESYEARVGWLAWNVRASHGQAPAVATLPEGWVPLTITHEGQYPEEVAYGPQIMMDRLGKWLGKYFAQAARADSVQEDAARLERERICAAIKAEDDYCVDHGDYMLDSDDCIKIVRGEWVRPAFSADAARKQGATT